MKLLIFCALMLGNAYGEERVIFRNLLFTEALSVKEFGGPDVTLAIKAAEITFLTVEERDSTKVTPAVRTHIDRITVDRFADTATVEGSNKILLLPTKATKRIEKRDGITLPGVAATLYLLYEDAASGVRVYFSDASAPQNMRSVVVVRKP